jgi:hypothetical protein
MQQNENKTLKNDLSNESEEDEEEENILGQEKKHVNDIIAWSIFCEADSTLLEFKVCIILHIKC